MAPSSFNKGLNVTTENLQDAPAVAVDLFCGVGGLTHGFAQEGFPVVAGFDVDESCRYAYEKNNVGTKFLLQDVTELSSETVKELYPAGKTRVLMGCAPCQPYSLYTQKKKPKSKADESLEEAPEKAQLEESDYDSLRYFATLVEGVRPEVVSMENVPQLTKHQVYSDFVRTLTRLRYHVWTKVVHCRDYGVPQKRKRLVLLASSIAPISLIEPTHQPEQYLTVRDVIGGLPTIEAGGCDSDDPLHRACGLIPLNKRRIEVTPAGGGWKDWPEDLRLTCHKKKTGKSYGGVYGRIAWDGQAPTMTTQCCGLGNGRFGHPQQHRAISLREAAIFQSFPETYEFFPKDGFSSIGEIERHIGNAVPVKLGQAIARSIKRHLEAINAETGNPDTPV